LNATANVFSVDVQIEFTRFKRWALNHAVGTD